MPRSEAASGVQLSDEPKSTTTLQAAQVSLRAYLTVLWNTAPPLRSVARQQQGDRTPPFLTCDGLHLPANVEMHAPNGADWYRAAAAHAAAHRLFSRHVFFRSGTAPITQALMDLLEDARVEASAWRTWPGLRRLWTQQHTVEPSEGDDFETLLRRLARALIDLGYDDPHPWVRKGQASFWLAGSSGPALNETTDPLLTCRMASALGHDIGQMRLGFNARSYRLGPSYRDDNHWLWHSDEPAQPGRPRAQSVQGGAQASVAVVPESPPVAQTWLYSEWDRRIARLRPRWCSVTERVASAHQSTAAAEPVGAQSGALVHRLRAFAADARHRSRREHEGDAIDLDAAIRSAVSRRQRRTPDARIHQRVQRQPRSAAAVLLLDTSTSSADPVAGAGSVQAALEVQKRAAAQLAQAMLAAGWRVAVMGFCSNGRHQVALQRVLDFGESWDAKTAQRLAGLAPAWSTRMGAALRHATYRLTQRAAQKRMIVVLGDGEPHDVDVYEPDYLRDDARVAVQAARARGVDSICLLPDPATAVTARRTFGAHGCFVTPCGDAQAGILAAFQC